MPVARTTNASTIGNISSHRTVGVMPLASANTSTAIEFMPRLKAAVSDTDSGTTMRGKRTFRSSPSRATSAFTQFPVASPRKFQSTIPVSRYTP